MNAAIFNDHFKQLYGRAPSGKMEVLKHTPKQRVFTELDHERTDDEEILNAVLGLNCSGLGDAGVAVLAVGAEPGRALLLDFADGSSRSVDLGLGAAGLALLVTDTRVSHELVDGGYGQRRADCEEAARLLGARSLRDVGPQEAESLDDERLRRRARHVVGEIERVRHTVEAFTAGDLPALGRLFLASHVSMRDDFEISCPELDAAVETAVEAGAVGARMTGGGFGGSSVALVPEDRVDAVARAIDLRFVRDGATPPAHLRVEPAGGASAQRVD